MTQYYYLYTSVKIFIVLVLAFSFYQCNDEIKKEIITIEEYNDEYDFIFKERHLFGEPLTTKYAENPENKYSKKKVELGFKLFNDNRLSIDNTVSCTSCHDIEKGGTDNLSVSVGVNGLKGDRNAPSVINAALHFRLFWDGRAKNVEEQAGMPILNSIEMGMKSKKDVVIKIRAINEYEKLFKNVFPQLEEPITFETITKAIASFERTLIKPAKFDKFLAGDLKVLTYNEKRGMYLFRQKCIGCHSGNLIGGERYRVFGLKANYWDFTGSNKIDKGLFYITKEESDLYKFKVPSLRNVEKTFPYFHDGSVKTLKEAIKVMGRTQKGEEFSDTDVSDIESFLKTLSSQQ